MTFHLLTGVLDGPLYTFEESEVAILKLKIGFYLTNSEVPDERTHSVLPSYLGLNCCIFSEIFSCDCLKTFRSTIIVYVK